MFRLKSKKIAGDIYWLFLKWIACRCVARSNSRETPRHSFASSSRLMWKYILGVCIHRVDTVAHDIHMMKSCRRKAFIGTSMYSVADKQTSYAARQRRQVKDPGLTWKSHSTQQYFFLHGYKQEKVWRGQKNCTLQTGPRNRLKHR